MLTCLHGLRSILGVDLDVITHKLLVYREVQPGSQKKRKLGEEKQTVEEANKLLMVGFIKEVQYTI